MSAFLLVVVLVVLLLTGFQRFMRYLKEQLQQESGEDPDTNAMSKPKNDRSERKRPFKPINWRVLLSNEIQRHLPDHKTEAIIRYRQLTGADVQDGERTIAYHIAYPNHIPARFGHYELSDAQIVALYNMVRQGKRAEAHRRYQALTGIDQFAADIALDILEQQMLTDEDRFNRLREDDMPLDAEEDLTPIARLEQKG